MFKISKRIEIAGSHRLSLPYESKCRNMHGHNWIITVHCGCADNLLDDNGMVIDFTHIKKQTMSVFDHQYINNIPPFDVINPTAENIAKFICDSIGNCWKVEVQESEGNTASYINDHLAQRYGE